jgi:hypothetical protein
MGKSRVDDKSAAAREEIDARLDALESFEYYGKPGRHDEEIGRFSNLLCAFHSGRESRVRFATIEQIERLKGMLAGVLDHCAEVGAYCYWNSDNARILIECDLPKLLESVAKLSAAREKQRLSGQGAYGRETLASLREKNARLETENAELRRDKVAKVEQEVA